MVIYMTINPDTWGQRQADLFETILVYITNSRSIEAT